MRRNRWIQKDPRYAVSQTKGIRTKLSEGKPIGCCVCTLAHAVPNNVTLYRMDAADKKIRYFCGLHYVQVAKANQPKAPGTELEERRK